MVTSWTICTWVPLGIRPCIYLVDHKVACYSHMARTHPYTYRLDHKEAYCNRMVAVLVLGMVHNHYRSQLFSSSRKTR